MTPKDIQDEYERLGCKLGWTFMMTKECLLRDASVCLVGLNPGGQHVGEAIWSCEEGNAYHGEKWPNSRLQVQVHRLEEILGLDPDRYFAAQFIPFRSPDWRRLENAAQARVFGRELWSWVLTGSPAKLFICLGREAAVGIAGLIGAKTEKRVSAGWDKQTIGRYVGADGRVVVRLPHLSRYGLFGRQGEQSATAVASLKEACKPVC